MALSLSLDQTTNNVIYYLSTEKKPVFKEKVSNRFIKYGFGHHVFEYDPNQSEEQNCQRLDFEHMKAYWNDGPMLSDLYKQ
jgi:hypothetical protein